jgi:CHAD domain-containing protein
VRRLRSWQRAFTPWLGKAASRKMKRRLRAIAHATNTSRDTAVQLAWLNQQRRTLSLRQRPGVDWLVACLKERQPAHTADALTAAHDFHALAVKLGRRLKRSDDATPARSTADDDRFGVAAARLVRGQSHALHQRLSSVRNSSDDAEAHGARIAAKSLRYLMEPIARAHDDSRSADAARLITQLKQLQDLLGDLHDAHMFAHVVVSASARSAAARARRLSEMILAHEPPGSRSRSRSRRVDADPGPGVLAIARRLHRRRMQAFTALQRDWLGGSATPFFDEVQLFGAGLVRRARTATPQGTVHHRAQARR